MNSRSSYSLFTSDVDAAADRCFSISNDIILNWKVPVAGDGSIVKQMKIFKIKGEEFSLDCDEYLSSSVERVRTSPRYHQQPNFNMIQLTLIKIIASASSKTLQSDNHQQRRTTSKPHSSTRPRFSVTATLFMGFLHKQHEYEKKRKTRWQSVGPFRLEYSSFKTKWAV